MVAGGARWMTELWSWTIPPLQILFSIPPNNTLEMFPKDHLLDPTIEYASLDNEMVACFPMILSTYAGPRDADICNAINPREVTKMF